MYNNIVGTFKQRGDNGVNNIPTLVEFAQDHFIRDIINVGSAGTDWISVVTTYTNDGSDTLQMVKRNTYELMDFTTERELNAFNNLDEKVVKFTGAYSHTYKV